MGILKKTKRTVILALVFCLGSVCSAGLAAEPVPPKTNEYLLANGLKVIIREDHRTPSVVSQLWYRVGSTYESNGLTGLSHALEHMMFKGTPKHPGQSFSELMAESGADHNAFTGFDYTVYFQQVDRDKLPFCLELEADRMANLQFSPEVFEKEKKVIIEERRLRIEDNPDRLALEGFFAIAHARGGYHHPIIGWMPDIEAFTVDDLKHWYAKWYMPNNAVLVIVGAVEPEAVMQQVEKTFGALKAGPLPAMRSEKDVTPFGARRLEMDSKTSRVPRLYLGYNVPSVVTAEAEWEPYALWAALEVLNGGYSSRLTKKLVRESLEASQISASYSALSRGDTVWFLSASPNQNVPLSQLEKKIKAEIQLLKTTLVSPEELNRVKRRIRAEQVFSRDSLVDQAQELGQLEAVGLSWREADKMFKRIDKVTAEQILAVAKKYLNSEREIVTNLAGAPS